MPTTTSARRCAVATLAGFAALSLAACGSSSTPSSSSTSKATSSSATSSAAASPAPGNDHPGKPKDRVMGLVDSVSGGTIKVTGQDGPATVDITPSTHVAQFGPGELSDIATGQCIAARPIKDSAAGPALTAAAVMYGQSDSGECGRKGAPHEHGVVGTVASVNGSTIVLTTADNGQATVTVTPDTRYTKRAKADASAITAGECLAAGGAKDGNGVLQATMAMVRPADNGGCGGGHPAGHPAGHRHN